MLILVISTVSLLLASLAFITSDRIHTQQTVSEHLAAVADIIAANSSAPLLFSDPVAAQETLGFLKSQQHVQAAAIYDIENELFSSYLKPGLDIELPTGDMHEDNVLFWGDYVELHNPIIYEG